MSGLVETEVYMILTKGHRELKHCAGQWAYLEPTHARTMQRTYARPLHGH